MSANLNVLLVDDNPGDVDLIQESLSSCSAHVAVHVVLDGVAALDYVRQKPPYTDVERPDLILLDLNLPKREGREVVAMLKQDPGFRRIPVVVLTSSVAERDVLQAYDLGANCYVTKPVGLEPFQKVIKALVHFWCSVVKLPKC